MQDKTRNGILIALAVTGVLVLGVWATVSKIQKGMQSGIKNLGEEISKEIEKDQAEAEPGTEATQGSKVLKALQAQLDHIRAAGKLAATEECSNLPDSINAYALEHQAALIEAKRTTQDQDGKASGTFKKGQILRIALIGSSMAAELIKINTQVVGRCPKEASAFETALGKLIDPEQVD